MDRSDVVSAVKEALVETLDVVVSELWMRRRIADLEHALTQMLNEYDGVHDVGTHQTELAKRACEDARAALDWPDSVRNAIRVAKQATGEE